MMVKTLGIGLVFTAMGIASIANGVYAFRAPQKYLNSALRYRMRPETPISQIRAFGLVGLIVGVGMLGVACLVFANLFAGSN